MQPSLDQLIQITRTLGHDYDFVRVVLASVQFIEISDGPEFRTELQQDRDSWHWRCRACYSEGHERPSNAALSADRSGSLLRQLQRPFIPTRKAPQLHFPAG